MNWFKRALGSQNRASVKASSPYLAEFFGLHGTGALAQVDTATASGLSVAYACIATISQTLASVPLSLYQRQSNDGRQKAVTHPLHSVLSTSPNGIQSAFEMREFLVASLLMYGNSYAVISWSGKGQVDALTPVHPSCVAVEKLGSRKRRYKVSSNAGASQTYLQNEMLRLRGQLAANGYLGLSPIQVARASFGLAIEQQTLAHTQAQKGFRPQGTLTFPDPISDEGKGSALDALAQKASDVTAKGAILALDGGAKWKPLAFSSKDSELFESRKLSDLAIARIYSCPPTSIGIPDHATYSNAFGENQALVSRCLAPMAKRIEQAMCNALLPRDSRRDFYIEHDLSALVRGDLASRYESYGLARQWGILTQNDIRAMENLSAVEGGDRLLEPLNMTTNQEDSDGNLESD